MRKSKLFLRTFIRHFNHDISLTEKAAAALKTMPRKSDFTIHVDPSCLTDSTDLQLPSKSKGSDQSTFHNKVENLHSPIEGSQIGVDVSHDEHTEALIHAAARAVVARIEKNEYEQADSVISTRTEDGYEAGTELTYGDETELTYGEARELDCDSDADHSNQDLCDGSASSHNEDDVFSLGARSNRSSLNSFTDEEHWKREEDKIENNFRSEQAQDHHPPTSRISSTTSNAYSLLPEPLTITPALNSHTPSKVLSRPAFRTPSSVRALQMSSPTPSVICGSPRSSKRPAVSRLGTPSTHTQSSMKTPTRFKVKKEYPLVLLHVTVIPLQWSYGRALDLVNGEGLPRELYNVKESWKLLKEKLADTVLERGILLPHPQDSYEMLEERLLEALELPVRPRAKILTCGHYLGPDDTSDPSSDDASENEEDAVIPGAREQWCDICGREVRYKELAIGGRQKRFRIKVYASNGLMRAGAWAAAWKEMERVDVEIEPFVPSHLATLMDSLMTFHSQPAQAQDTNPGKAENHYESDVESEQRLREEEEAMRRREREEERMREVYGDNPPAPSAPEFEDILRPQRASSRRDKYGDSLPDLIWAAIKVVMRDRKQVAICVLSVLVLILALPSSAVPKRPEAGAEIDTCTLGKGHEVIGMASNSVAHKPAQVVDVVKAVTDEAVTLVQPKERPVADVKEEVSEFDAQELPPAGDEPLESETGGVEGGGGTAMEENMMVSLEMT